ncbi:TonB-dependent receptor [Sinomicrobium oceani]|uniref:TonB-dependent receptor n=1 Tax=Sinomicrobium oceani TaxID=1150368 RepID=UPI00227BC381|nr:TonB-dependent receptor [Sinomicrobium oceani]
MKLLLSLFFATLLQINAGLEGARNQRITLHLKSVTVQEIIQAIESTTDFKFLYSHEELDNSRKLNIRAKNETLESVLQKVFGNSSIAYKVVENQVVLTRKGKHQQDAHDTESLPVQEQHIVTGIISDAQGPIPGVSIYIKDSDRGTFSNADGQYSITANPTAILVFSYIGYRTVERTVGNLTIINVELQEDVTELNEVVLNAGYYTTTEKERTGNISQVTAREIEQQPVSNPLAALQGRMAGVDIRQTTGVPGGAFRIQIRGQNSLRADANYPLFIIDGVPIISEPLTSIGGLIPPESGLDPLNAINPSDIESVEILKDADATSIYGSRGANGVVLITTKKGSLGKTRIDLNLQTGMSRISNKMKLLNTDQYLEMRREAFENDGVEPTIGRAPDLLLWNQNRATDWQKELLGGTAYIVNAQTSISGGTSNTSYVFGGAYRKETTVFSSDFGDTKITGHAQLNHRSNNDRFKLSLSINYGLDKLDLFNTSSFTKQALTLPPNAPALYDDDGNLNWELAPDGSPSFENPAASFLNKSNIITKNLISNAVMEYRILSDWTIKTNLGYTDLNQEETTIQPQDGLSPLYQNVLPSFTFLSTQSRNSWIVEPQILYHKKFKSSKLEMLVGWSWQQNTNYLRGVYGSGYSSDRLLGSLSGATDVALLQDTENDYRYQAFFSRIGYTYKGRYILNLTGRRDGSSRFGADKQYGNFGAMGAAWIFSEEKWVRKHFDFLSFGKLRGSYGTTGNDQISDYGYLDTYRVFTGNYRGVGGLYPTRLANPEYGWEVNKKLEAALDLGLFRERIHFSLSWYRNRSSNQLVGYRLPATTGFSTIQANMPATVQNTGWELDFTSQNISSEALNWNTNFNLTIPQNKLLKYPNIDDSPYGQTLIVGEPINISRRYVFNGVNPQTGFYEVIDQNGDGQFNIDDRIHIENIGRRFYGGIKNNLSYKNLQLDFLIEFVKQKSIGFLNTFSNSPGYLMNQPVAVLERWQQSGDENNVQRYTQSNSNRSYFSNVTGSNFNIQDASFIRFKNVSLSYTFPKEFLQPSSINNLKVFVLGQNLLTWTNYIGMDPQSPGGTYLPALRTITMGVQLQF